MDGGAPLVRPTMDPRSESGKTVMGVGIPVEGCPHPAYPRRALAPWVPGAPGMSKNGEGRLPVGVAGGRGGAPRPHPTLGPRSESGMTVEKCVPGFPGMSLEKVGTGCPRYVGESVWAAFRLGVVVGGRFRSLGFARDDSERARDDS